MTALDAAVAELAALMPALAAALERDTGPAGGHTTITPGSVVNGDVLHAMITLRTEVPRAARRACETAGEPWAPRGMGACLRMLPRLSERLTAVGLPGEASAVEDAARRWLRVTKQALGLRTPDIPVGCPCPHHDLPLTGLVAAGSEGFLRRSRDGVTVEWEHPARVFCPWCGSSWGPGQWLMLGRMLQEAS